MYQFRCLTAMSVVQTVSSCRRDELLRAVCERSVPLQLTSVTSGGVKKHKSRFLRGLLDAEGMHLLVQAPSEQGSPVSYDPSESIEVFFQINGQRYGFRSEVEGRGLHLLRKEVVIPALIIFYPEEVERHQRRAHYRVLVSASPPCVVTLCQKPGPTGDVPTLSDGNMCSGVLRDIGAGGVGVLGQEPLLESFGVGAEILVSFQLPGHRGHMHLEAVIRQRRIPSRRGGWILGLEFVNVEKKPDVRRVIDEIRRFVAERQREVLRRARKTRNVPSCLSYRNLSARW